MRVPDDAYVAHAQGEISDEEFQGIQKFASLLGEPEETSKEAAAAPIPHVPLTAMQEGRSALIMGGGAAAGMAVVGGLATGAVSMKNRLTYRRDLNKVLEVHPDISENYSPRDVNLAFSSLRSMNPDMANDPLVGGNLLAQILRNRDITDPTKAPRFPADVAMSLYSAKKGYRDPTGELLKGSLESGMSTAAKRLSSKKP